MFDTTRKPAFSRFKSSVFFCAIFLFSSLGYIVYAKIFDNRNFSLPDITARCLVPLVYGFFLGVLFDLCSLLIKTIANRLSIKKIVSFKAWFFCAVVCGVFAFGIILGLVFSFGCLFIVDFAGVSFFKIIAISFVPSCIGGFLFGNIMFVLKIRGVSI